MEAHLFDRLVLMIRQCLLRYGSWALLQNVVLLCQVPPARRTLWHLHSYCHRVRPQLSWTRSLSVWIMEGFHLHNPVNSSSHTATSSGLWTSLRAARLCDLPSGQAVSSSGDNGRDNLIPKSLSPYFFYKFSPNPFNGRICELRTPAKQSLLRRSWPLLSDREIPGNWQNLEPNV